jgi:hypothetical protein
MIFLVLMMGLIAGSVRGDGIVCAAQDDLGTVAVAGDATDIVVVGEYLYVAAGVGGLAIYSLVDERAPLLVSQADGFGVCLSLFVDGDFAYMATEDDGLDVVDISDRSNPFWVGSFSITGSADRIFVKSGIALITGGESRITIIDVSDPSAMRLRGEYLSDDLISGVFVKGDLAYVAGAWAGLSILDIQSPGTPFEIGVFEQASGYRDVVVEGDYAYLAGGSPFGLQSLDVSDPYNPVLLSSILESEDGQRVRIHNGRAYILSNRNVLSIVDVKSPASPQLVGRYTLAYQGGMDLSGTTAYISTTDGIRVLDVSDPSPSPVIANVELLHFTEAMVMDTNIAYAVENGLLRVIDASDPTQPTQLGQVSYPFASYGVAVRQGYVFVVQGNFLPVKVFDVSDPSNPVLAYSFVVPNGTNASDILIEGDTAYFLNIGLGVVLADVSNPLSPVYLGTAFADGYLKEMSVDGDRLYISSNSVGIISYDISDPINVIEVGRFDPGHLNRMSDIVVRDSIAYVADNTTNQQKYIRAFDMSYAQSPTLLGVFDSGPFYDIGKMKIQGRYLFANIGNDLMKVIDIIDPSNLTFAGMIDANGDFVLDDDLAFVASGFDFVVLDISTNCLPCPADFTGDGRVNFFDISAFLQLLVIEDPAADFNNDGRWNFFDISAFLQVFAVGCP